MAKKGLPALLLLAVGFASGLGGPLPPSSAREGVVEANGSRSYVFPFKADARASVVIVGRTNQTNLGLYVFDRHGNCITWDDQGAAANRDDCAVEWYPPRTEPYTIEVRNLGPLRDGYDIAMP